MSIRRLFNHYKNENPLALKILTSIILCSSIITLLATGSQLYFDYKYERSAIDQQIKQIESSSLASLENSLWEISPEQIQLQLDGIKKLRDVEFVLLTTPFNERYSSGELSNASVLKKNYKLTHSDIDKEYLLGTLQLVITLDNLHHRLWDKALLILLSQGIKTFLVSLFILSIFHHLVTQHLIKMASHARGIQLEKPSSALQLNRTSNSGTDELTNVVDSLNKMQTDMQRDMQKRIIAEQQLSSLNQELETRVQQRTAQLELSNRELQLSLDTLQRTQTQLIESQKMASLGNLVAGVAHEISTPIGIAYTAVSYLQQQTSQHSGELADIAIESSAMISSNLQRAASLISAFKQVSVDQSTQKRRVFNLANYLNEILLSLKPKLRNSATTVIINCDSQIELDSYPGSFYQIFNNLIINSMIHGPINTGDKIQVNIDITQQQQNLIIDYTDNGSGLDQEWENKVFEPFATSKRSLGCSGLGMHICYNLVHHLLKGEIRCINSAEGAHFKITLDIHTALQQPLKDIANL
ncbi:MAG: histidine kinase [Oceanospirillaceae bacterium]|nr:histidine kinase [Oceanospirillaceae bacterium]